MSSTFFSSTMLGSMISTPKVTRNAPKASPWVNKRRVASVSVLAIILFAGLLISKISESYPSVLVAAIFRVVTSAPSMVMLELKKLFAGLAPLLKLVKPGFIGVSIRKASPVIPRSPSTTLAPSRARTGPTGIVLKPETVMSALELPRTPAYPSKTEMYFPVRVGFS